MKTHTGTLLLLAGLAFSSLAEAEVAPSFSLRFSALKATHIAVVAEGRRIDGELDVLECWKGDLAKGDSISVPELAQFARKDSRVVQRQDRRNSIRVTGDRMIIFLVKSVEPTDERGRDKDAPAEKVRWLPAGMPGYETVFGGEWSQPDESSRARACVVWLDRGSVFAIQEQEDGTSQLVMLRGTSEEDIRASVQRFMGSATAFQTAAATPDPVKRAEALVPFTQIENHHAAEQAFNALAECGMPALLHLRKMIDDPKWANRHYLVVRYMARAGRSRAAPDLIRVLQGELEFWRQHAPILAGTRWRDLSPELRMRHLKLEQTLQAVDWVGPAEAREVVESIRQLWNTQPRLARLKILIIARCDHCLHRLDEKHRP